MGEYYVIIFCGPDKTGIQRRFQHLDSNIIKHHDAYVRTTVTLDKDVELIEVLEGHFFVIFAKLKSPTRTALFYDPRYQYEESINPK